MITAADVVSIALGEVGYKEKASNADLDLATANAGTANWTKYARDLYNAGYYNGNKNGYAWCDVFVDWCFFKAFGKTEGQMVECQTGDLGAACPYSASYYRAQGRYDKSPQVGDQVFFQQNGSLVHTGIVVAVTSSQITTVEGNSGNQVKKNTYSRSSSYIAGYGHPLYDGEVAPSGGTTPTPAPADPTAKVKEWQNWLGVDADGEYGPQTEDAAVRRMLAAMLAKYPLKPGAKGDAVKVLQGRLYSLGYDTDGLDGDYGQATTAAVKAYQGKNGLLADGEAGKDTFTVLLDL